MGAAQELVDAIAGGKTTAVEATEQAIKRIEDGDGDINAVVVRDFDRARAEAKEADARLARGERAPLLGLPMTVKESINIAGLPTTWGYAEHANFIADRDAVLATRLKKAGAVIVGKTNVPPGLADLQSVNPVYGATHNPHMHGRSSGGSSGGAAASLAAGFVTAEVGSDIGGSIRTPAAFCGVWGLKPTHGIISKAGHSMPGTDGSDDVLSVVGPMARSAEDLDLLLGVLADHPLPAPREGKLAGLRVAVVAAHPLAPMSSDVASTLEARAAQLETLGATIDRTPKLPDLEAMHRDYLRLLNTVMSHGIPPAGREPVTLAAWFDMLDTHARTGREWDAALSERYDAVLAPVFGTTAFPLDDNDIASRMIEIDGRSEPCASQLAWAGLAIYPGLPSVSFPAGKGSEGLPIGLQLIGPRYADREVLRIASQIAI
ncbi:amidase [Antricoccus suffuscus]|uniref:Amidase n=1 Tax=Antricoccus suffuscus TaxID=1629062 RepID=A0A2T1A1I3_9ACTN|nr:amidase family protein [Antricoccus suffuscus]PRZ42462.1 amidase [Antricoccus suffuscus]